jgi:hypothetical protein
MQITVLVVKLNPLATPLVPGMSDEQPFVFELKRERA